MRFVFCLRFSTPTHHVLSHKRRASFQNSCITMSPGPETVRKSFTPDAAEAKTFSPLKMLVRLPAIPMMMTSLPIQPTEKFVACLRSSMPRLIVDKSNQVFFQKLFTITMPRPETAKRSCTLDAAEAKIFSLRKMLARLLAIMTMTTKAYVIYNQELAS